MAVVRTPAERIRDRLAVAAVIAITIVMLAPIYWIASTAFKPRSLATTPPPPWMRSREQPCSSSRR